MTGAASPSPSGGQPTGEAPQGQEFSDAFPADPGDYASAAVLAWNVGDAARLNQLAGPGGILHGLPATAGFSLAYCAGTGAATCVFVNGAGDELALILDVQRLGFSW